jgi:hypothetical protein
LAADPRRFVPTVPSEAGRHWFSTNAGTALPAFRLRRAILGNVATLPFAKTQPRCGCPLPPHVEPRRRGFEQALPDLKSFDVVPIAFRSGQEVDLDAAYISAMFGLGGATIGALASFLTTWMTHRSQFQDKLREAERARRIELYNDFITEAVRLYGDALSHERDDVGDLVLLYALVAKMQLIASRATIDAAESVIDRVTDAYLGPNQSLHEIRELAREGKLRFLTEFGVACRADLQASVDTFG